MSRWVIPSLAARQLAGMAWSSPPAPCRAGLQLRLAHTGASPIKFAAADIAMHLTLPHGEPRPAGMSDADWTSTLAARATRLQRPKSSRSMASGDPQGRVLTVTHRRSNKSLSLPIPNFVQLNFADEASTAAAAAAGAGAGAAAPAAAAAASGTTTLQLAVTDPSDKKQKQMWGTTRTLIANMVRGLTEEFTVLVHFEGVGYRAALAPVPTAPDYPGQQQLVMRLGYCNDMIERVPFGVSVRIPSAQRLVLQGPDLQVVTQLAAKIRAHRPPEPYNQKGVFVGDETIAKKEGKR